MVRDRLDLMDKRYEEVLPQKISVSGFGIN